MSWPRLNIIAACLTFLALLLLPGCLLERPANRDWATPAPETAGNGGSAEIQSLLDSYAAALVAKDRESFAALLDPGSPAFVEQQLERFDRLREVPFAQYQMKLVSKTEPAPGSAIAKVNISYSLAGSFSNLPDAERTAFSLVKGEDGWKLSGDATEAALGKPRDGQLADFGPVSVLISEHAIVMYNPAQLASAARAGELIDAAYPRLASTFPDASLPRVPVKVFAGRQQLDLAYPGKWQEWTGGAARRLGDDPGQGGEIILDASSFSELSVSNPGYIRRMMAHELTHIVLFDLTGARTPPFLIEGLADYVAGEEQFPLLKDQLRRGQRLNPSLSDLYQPGAFSVLLSQEAAQLAYEESDTAVAYLEQQFGNDRVRELLREFKRRSGEKSIDQGQLVDDTFRLVLGIGWQDFEADWRRYAGSL